MKEEIHLSILTSEGSVYDRMVGYVNIPTAFGSLGVLTGHAPMLCAVSKGLVRCSYGAYTERIQVGEGVANVSQNEVTILVASAKRESSGDEHIEDMD